MEAGTHRYVRVIRRRTVAVPAEAAVAAVQDIKAIEKTEVKADRVEVFPESETTGTYAVTGHFARVPWRSRFARRIRLNRPVFGTATQARNEAWCEKRPEWCRR